MSEVCAVCFEFEGEEIIHEPGVTCWNEQADRFYNPSHYDDYIGNPEW